MRDEYNIKALNPRKNPYCKASKQQVTMNMKTDTVDYFKSLASDSGVPYQTLINFFLDQCVQNKMTLSFVKNA